MATYHDLEKKVYEGFVIDEIVDREKGRTFLLVNRDGSEKVSLKIGNRSLVPYLDMLSRLVDASREADGKERVWWCLKCEQAFRQPERQLLGQQCPNCMNRGSIYRWSEDEWPRSNNPQYPDIPELGRVYPLYGQSPSGKAGNEDRLMLAKKVRRLAENALDELDYWVTSGESKVLQDAQTQFMEVWEMVMRSGILRCRFSNGTEITRS